MRNNETGEFELVVGNRQLLSGFFIVVLLFAVSFAIQFANRPGSTTRPISAETRVEGGKQVAEVEIDQPEFGVVPFKAMMGTLKVKPVVRVKVSVPNA